MGATSTSWRSRRAEARSRKQILGESAAVTREGRAARGTGLARSRDSGNRFQFKVPRFRVSGTRHRGTRAPGTWAPGTRPRRHPPYCCSTVNRKQGAGAHAPIVVTRRTSDGMPSISSTCGGVGSTRPRALHLARRPSRNKLAHRTAPRAPHLAHHDDDGPIDELAAELAADVTRDAVLAR